MAIGLFWPGLIQRAFFGVPGGPVFEDGVCQATHGCCADEQKSEVDLGLKDPPLSESGAQESGDVSGTWKIGENLHDDRMRVRAAKDHSHQLPGLKSRIEGREAIESVGTFGSTDATSGTA